MRIGWNGGGHHHSLESIRADAKRAAEEGFSSFWLSQIFGPDSLTALAAIAEDAPGIELGTSVVPLYRSHPVALAQQALTVQAATGGRLTLGIGPAHQIFVEHMLGLSWARPYTQTKEALAVINGLVRGEARPQPREVRPHIPGLQNLQLNSGHISMRGLANCVKLLEV